MSKIAKLSHFYNGAPNDSLDDGFLSGLKYTWASKNKKSIINLLKFKNWGAPYYKFKKTFPDTPSQTQPATGLHPDKKSAWLLNWILFKFGLNFKSISLLTDV